MKPWGKITSLIPMIILCAITLCCPVNARFDEEKAEPVVGDDYVFTSGDWQYYLLGENISVCGYTGSGEKITVPSEIDGKKVTKVSGRRTSDEVYLTFSEKKFSFFSGNGVGVKEVIIPEGVLSIGIYTFQSSGIEKITLPKSLISIGYNAFWNCESLETVTIPENVKIIGRSAFGESGLKEVYLPEGLESIGEFAFDSTYIKQIYLPDTVTEIGKYAFSHTELEEVTLPKGILRAEGEIFYGCDKLKKACISESTLTVSGKLFSNCGNLEELYLPSTLKSLSDMSECSRNLKTVNFAGSKEQWENSFGNDTGTLFSYIVGDYYQYVQNKDIKMNYDVPIPISQPIPQPIPYPEEKFRLDAEAVILIIITALGIVLTVGFAISFIKRARGVQKKRAEIKIREEKEGFHPDILGVWQCEKCRTHNSPIAGYCYKCGRKRRENQ